jgi:hypothetical protein
MFRFDRDMPDEKRPAAPVVDEQTKAKAMRDAAKAVTDSATTETVVTTPKRINEMTPEELKAFQEERLGKITTTRKTGGGTNPPYPAPTGTKWSFIGGEWKLYNLATTSNNTPPIVTFTPSNNNTGAPSITQADLDAAVKKATEAANSQTAALVAQQKAKAEADKMANKMKASDKLRAMFEGFGLGSLANFIDKRIMEDASEEVVLLELYEQPEYKMRFPGMANLRSKKRTITEGEYMNIEKAMTQTARFFDLPEGFYDNPDDFGKLIGSEVSAKEYQDRLQVGQDLARQMSPSARAQLQEFYNVGEGGITAYVLDPDRALAIIQKQAKAAQFVGFGREKGFKLEGMTAAQAEQIAGTEAYSKLSALQMEQSLGQAAQLRKTQSRLTGIEGEVYNEQEALKAVIEGSPEAILASQQRAQREGARFGGGSGITGSSLRSTPGI